MQDPKYNWKSQVTQNTNKEYFDDDDIVVYVEHYEVTKYKYGLLCDN